MIYLVLQRKVLLNSLYNSVLQITLFIHVFVLFVFLDFALIDCQVWINTCRSCCFLFRSNLELRDFDGEKGLLEAFWKVCLLMFSLLHWTLVGLFTLVSLQLTVCVNNSHYSIVVWVIPCVFASLRTPMKMSLTLKRYGFMRSSSPSFCSVNITQHMPCLSSQATPRLHSSSSLFNFMWFHFS